MNVKQKRFCDEYLIDCNATQAAIRAGYSEKSAKSIGSSNLRRQEVKDYIEEQLDTIHSEKLADATEIMEYLTTVLRGENVLEKDNTNTTTRLPDIRERLKAAELLGKRFGLFKEIIDEQEVLPVVISGENELE